MSAVYNLKRHCPSSMIIIKSGLNLVLLHFADAPSLAALACEAAGEQKQLLDFS